MELQSQRAQVVGLEPVLKQQGAVLETLQNDFTAAVSDFEGRMNTLAERIRTLESGMRQQPEHLIEETTRGKKLSETAAEKDVAETTIHREQIAGQIQGVQDLSGEKELAGAPLTGEARGDESPQLEKAVTLPSTLTGDVDLVLPRSADRITLEVIVAVLQEQPGVSVRKMQAYRDVLVVPVQLVRPVPLVAILRELPRVTSAELVPTGWKPVGTAPLHVIVQIT
jgi:hypothetical protein